MGPDARVIALKVGGIWPSGVTWDHLRGASLLAVVAAEQESVLRDMFVGAAPENTLWLDIWGGAARVCVAAVVRQIDELWSVTLEPVSEGGALTPERLAEHRLAEIGILSSGIAHDFNNILSAILGNTELLAELLPPVLGPGSEDLLAALADIATAAHRSRDLIGQMLSYAVKAQPSWDLVDMSALAQEMIRLLRVSTPQNVVFVFGLDEALPPVRGDPSQLRQVLMNLIVNAADAIGTEPGSITVRTGTIFAERTSLAQAIGGRELAEGDYVFVEVVDTGCGMDEATLGRIFDTFFTTKKKGHGLGLAGVRTIIGEHAGALWVRSTVGLGTTFQVLLPVTRERDERGGEEVALVEVDLRGRSILVIDDEAIVRRMARRILEARGARVLDAEDGHQGIEEFVAARGAIDVVLLNVSLPYVDGIEVYREMAMIDPSVRVLLISGYSGAELQRRMEGIGAVGFLPKPFSAALLTSAIGRVLAG